MKTISTKAKSWINLIVFLITLIINYLTASGLINGMSQKVVSNKYNTLITPAGFAFSIWGLIYFLIGSSLVYMLVKVKETKVKNLIGILTPIFLFKFKLKSTHLAYICVSKNTYNSYQKGACTYDIKYF